jgi:hypothetical protein
MSERLIKLIEKYGPYTGREVIVTAPEYQLLRADGQERAIQGTVVGLAQRENGHMAGTTVDMVIRTAEGRLRTINISRITSCRQVAGTCARCGVEVRTDHMDRVAAVEMVTGQNIFTCPDGGLHETGGGDR